MPRKPKAIVLDSWAIMAYWEGEPAAEQVIFDGLKWLGLDWDEGPDIGGPYLAIELTQLALRLRVGQHGHSDPADGGKSSGENEQPRNASRSNSTLESSQHHPPERQSHPDTSTDERPAVT